MTRPYKSLPQALHLLLPRPLLLCFFSVLYFFASCSSASHAHCFFLLVVVVGGSWLFLGHSSSSCSSLRDLLRGKLFFVPYFCWFIVVVLLNDCIILDVVDIGLMLLFEVISTLKMAFFRKKHHTDQQSVRVIWIDDPYGVFFFCFF